jgi:hypothetical protein
MTGRASRSSGIRGCSQQGSLSKAISAKAAPLSAIRPLTYGYSISQGGPYHKDVLPDGTIIGPIAPDANGG